MPSTASVQPNRSNRLMRTHPDGGVYLQDGNGGKRLRFEKENTDCLPNAANFWRRAHLQVACTCDLLSIVRGAWGGCRPDVWNESSEVCEFLVECRGPVCENL